MTNRVRREKKRERERESERGWNSKLQLAACHGLFCFELLPGMSKNY